MKGEEYIPSWLHRPYGNYFDAGGRLPDGAGVVYRDSPADQEQLSKYYVDYVNKHRSDKDFDPSIYSSNPYNIYDDDDVIGYNVLPAVHVKGNNAEKIKRQLINERTPSGIPTVTSFVNGLRNAASHPTNTASATSSFFKRHIPFLRGESGSYVKDLSDSRLARITPDTKNVKSILGNSFIEQDNANTIRTAGAFKHSGGDTLLGDRRVPLRNFKMFMGVVDGKLRVLPIDHFDDSDVVVPVYNKTDLTYSLKRQSAADMVRAAQKAKYWRDTPPVGVSDEAAADSARRYDNLSSYPAGFTRIDGTFVPMTNMRREKSLLVSPNGNSMFLNNIDKFTPQQDSLVNAFLRRNGGAYPVQIDNGRYSHYLEGDGATYDRYMSADLFRSPESVWAFGEVE